MHKKTQNAQPPNVVMGGGGCGFQKPTPHFPVGTAPMHSISLMLVVILGSMRHTTHPSCILFVCPIPHIWHAYPTPLCKTQDHTVLNNGWRLAVGGSWWLSLGAVLQGCPQKKKTLDLLRTRLLCILFVCRTPQYMLLVWCILDTTPPLTRTTSLDACSACSQSCLLVRCVCRSLFESL